jgi:hypothetical protein
MKVGLGIVSFLFFFAAFSQSNFTVFNNNGQAFYVILNGIKQNSLPQTNVYVSGLKNGAYSTKLIFSDGKTPDIDKNFFIDAPSDITTRIIFKKGKGKLQLLSMEPTQGALQQTGVVYYRQDNYAVYSDAPVSSQVVQQTIPDQSNQSNMQVSGNQLQNTMNTNGQVNGNVNLNMNVGLNAGMNTNSSSSTTTTTTSTTTSSQSTSENINMNVGVNVNGGGIATQTQTENVNMNVGMNVNGGGIATQTQTENVNMNVGMNVNGMNTTTQNGASNVNVGVTTSGVSTAVQPPNGNVNISVNGTGTNTSYDNNQNYGNNSNQVNQQTAINSNSTTSVICSKTFTDLQDYLVDLKSITFEEDKVETIKKDFAATCLMANQAVEIVKTLTFEANRFEIATYLYDRMFDKNNGRLLTPLFTFEATKNDYRDYMRK